MIDVKENMRRIQEEMNLTSNQVATSMGISDQQYSNFFHTQKRTTVEFLLKFCNALHLDVYYPLTYPQKYVPEELLHNECPECLRKQETIDNLNDYIRLLKKKQNK